MKTKWNLLVVFVLLASLVGGTTSTARAQETHYFTWTPNPPAEGGTATFTVTPPDPYDFLVLHRSTIPGATICDYTLATAWYPSSISTTTDFGAPGDYLFCLEIYPYQGAEPIWDYQTVSVTNMPPFPMDIYYIYPEPSQVGEPLYTASAYFNDYDPMDTWNGFTCTVDYGDGTGPQPATWSYPLNQYNECIDPEHTYTAVGTYTITFRVYEPGVAEPGIGAYTHVVEPAPPPMPLIYDIAITSKAGRNNTSTYTGLVTVVSETGPLSRASVTANWMRILADGTHELAATQNASTNRTGVAKFTLRSASTGTYDLCVTNVVAKGFTWPDGLVVCYTDIHAP